MKKRSAVNQYVAEKLGVKVESRPELLLLNRIRYMHLPEPQTQVQLVSDRRFRYDFAWPDYRIAVEVQGGTFANGAHTRGVHYRQDCIKSALAQIAGYIVLYVTPEMIDSGQAGLLLTDALRARGWSRR